MSTTSPPKNVNATNAMSPAQKAVGAMDHTTVKSLAKSIARHSARRVAVLVHVLVNAVTRTVPVAVMVPRRKIALPVAISTMMASAKKNVHPCKSTILPIICGSQIRRENMPMAPRVSNNVPNIC